MTYYTVMLASGTTGNYTGEGLEEGMEVTIESQDVNGNPFQASGVVEEIFTEETY